MRNVEEKANFAGNDKVDEKEGNWIQQLVNNDVQEDEDDENDVADNVVSDVENIKEMANENNEDFVVHGKVATLVYDVAKAKP